MGNKTAETKKGFLGGTCNGSLWREELIKELGIDYFHPASDEWTPEMMEEEIKQRYICDFCLYVITPKNNELSNSAYIFFQKFYSGNSSLKEHCTIYFTYRSIKSIKAKVRNN